MFEYHGAWSFSSRDAQKFVLFPSYYIDPLNDMTLGYNTVNLILHVTVLKLPVFLWLHTAKSLVFVS